MTRVKVWLRLIAVLTLSGVGSRLSGQDAVQAEVSGEAAQPPALSQRVARLFFVSGSLQVQRADNTGEDGAVLNMPLHDGTRLLAGDDGRAEIEFEDGSLLRMTPGSGISLDSLALHGDAAETHISLLSGTAYFELRAAKGFAYTVALGRVEIAPVENVAFRAKLAGDLSPELAVLSGTARVDAPERFRVEVRAGESLRLDAADPTRYFLDATYSEEAWDWWNEERDQAASDQAAHATEARSGYAGAQGYGWSDMDANGTWYDVPGLGLVWQPDAADASFDPYGYGDWVFDSGQYTYVSGYSWGWTPFRCGRWAWTSGFGWGWSGAAECGRWGFGGLHRIALGTTPGRYPRPDPPPLGGHIHRIVAVRGPDGARPSVLARDRPVVVNGHLLQPLRTIGSSYTPHGGSAVGRALLRDFPLTQSRQPMMGVEAGTMRAAAGAPGWHNARPRPETPAAVSPGRTAMGTLPRVVPPAGAPPGVVALDATPGTASQRVPRVPPGTPIPSGTSVAPGVPLGASHSEPVRPIPSPSRPAPPTPAPVIPVRRPELPVAPVRPAPAVSPAPVRSAPAPSPAPAGRTPQIQPK